MTNTQEAKLFIEEFIGRLNAGEVACFNVSYVGYEADQVCTLSCATKDGEIHKDRLAEMLRVSLTAVEAKTVGVLQ